LARNWDDPEACIIEAVGYGGDTDTIASIAGILLLLFYFQFGYSNA
jgi:ADP-ribosylglycohydrolase